MKRWITIGLALALVGGGWFWWEETNEVQAPSYHTTTVKRGTVSSKVSATGTLQAVKSIDVGSQVSGMIDQVYVEHNSHVSKGQVLAQLDPSTYQTAIVQATASVNNAESSLANAQADAANAMANVRAADAAVVSAQAAVSQAQVGVISAKAAISSARARVKKAESTRNNLKKSFERSQELQGRELIALADLDAAQANYDGSEADVDTAQADLSSALAGLESAQVNVGSKQTEVESARIKREATKDLVVAAQARIRGYEAQVTQAKANLRTAEINLERTTITSPIDGIVLDVAITAGQTVAAQLQAPNLFTLAEDLSQMQVETSVDEADISKVKQGAQAAFTVDAFPEQNFTGVVTEVRQSPVAVSGVVTYLVIIRTENPKGELKPGMTATVEIIENEREDVLMIPDEALTFKPTRSSDGSAARATRESSKSDGQKVQGPRVFTLENGNLVRHSVKTGLSDGINTELISGDLVEGQEVVLSVSTGTTTTSKRSSSSGKQRSGGPGGPPGGMRMF